MVQRVCNGVQEICEAIETFVDDDDVEEEEEEEEVIQYYLVRKISSVTEQSVSLRVDDNGQLALDGMR
jgi:hypothetical protein